MKLKSSVKMEWMISCLIVSPTMLSCIRGFLEKQKFYEAPVLIEEMVCRGF